MPSPRSAPPLSFLALRGLRAAGTLAAAASLVFLLTLVAPGDAASTALGTGSGAGPRHGGGGLPSAEREALRARWGLDRPPAVRLGRWLAGAARLDLGRSFSDGRPVTEKVAEALPVTAALNLAALFLAVGIALPAGVVAARRPGGPADRAASALFDLLFAVPPFVSGFLLLLLFSARWRLFPLFADPAFGARAFVLPAVTLSLGALAPLSRFFGVVLGEAFGSPSALAARARGEGEAALLGRALRHAAGPLAGLAAVLVPAALGGSVLVERLFSLPGCGALLADAVLSRDEPLVLGLAFLSAAAVVLAAGAASLAASYLDPRLAGPGRGGGGGEPGAEGGPGGPATLRTAGAART